MSLSPKWKVKQAEVAAFRETIKNQPDAPRAYTFTKEQLQRILDNNGKELDGIRFYFGHKKDAKGHTHLTLVAVGCTKDATGMLNDFNVPDGKPVAVKMMAAATAATAADGNGGGDTLPDPEDPGPCPSVCGTTTNILNP